MLDRLLETGPRQRKSAWGGATSVVVHAAIIVLAVYSTGGATARARFVGDGPVIPIVAPPDRGGGAVHPSHTGGASTSSRTVSPTSLPGVDLNIDPPPMTGTSAATGVDSLLADIGSGRGSGSGTGVVLGGVTGATGEAMLDIPVRVVADRTPAYPELLRSAGIAGMVRVQFVVDTAGRAELSSIRVLDSSHELFTRAVLAALRQSRFTAGELAGRRVRTLVERSYRFDVGGVR
ncbi:MAG: energy transducer TonB [Gemmatimonadaceae bacterium]